MKRTVNIFGYCTGGPYVFENKTVKDCAEEATRLYHSFVGTNEDIVTAKVIEEDGKEWIIPVEIKTVYEAKSLRQGMADE